MRPGLLASGAMWAGLGCGVAGAQSVEPPVTPATDVITIVGSQIVGAVPTETLPVTVIRQREIDAIAAASGDELFRAIPQLGDVGFNTTRTVGGVNDARGDTASINLRALGTGNTLVLLNGRRMVNHPGVQAENLVPVVTVNTNSIPVMGVARVEVLLDGASALYGADAVAGVVNTVLKSDFEGFAFELQGGKEEGVDAAEISAAFQLGIEGDDGRTSLSLFGSYFGRDPIYASERKSSRTSDLRALLDPAWRSDATASAGFNNTSLTSAWGIFDRVSAGNVTVNGTPVSNAAGQFHLQPTALSGCLAQLADGVCIGSTSTRPQETRYDINQGATVQNGIDRFNLMAMLRHEINDELEFFGEASAYLADSVGYREVAPMLGAIPIVVPASNYWNPFGPVGSPNRLAVTNAPAGGLDLVLGSLTGTSAYRPIDAGPRKAEIENLATRVLGGLRGDIADWSWESALLYSQANTVDSENRISNTLFQQSLARSTPDAYNPFNGGCVSNYAAGDCTPSNAQAIRDITVQVQRKSETSLASWDFKISRPDAFQTWAGDAGVAAGLELRRETYADDRDARQDGTAQFSDPLNPAVTNTNDLMGNNASLDTRGGRNVRSAWAEVRLPLASKAMDLLFLEEAELQLAVRHEDFDLFGAVTKPKVALSARPFDFLLLRSAWSEGFRAPNLQQQFETSLLRSNNRNDYIRCEAALRRDPAIVFGANGCSKPASSPVNVASTYLVGQAGQAVISDRRGSKDLKPEESKNLTYGVVIDAAFLPPEFGQLSFTADWWRIEQDRVIGIFGDQNQVLLDYALRVQGSSNPAVVRAAPDADDIAAFTGTGLAPVGDIISVADAYLNLDRRVVQGWDFGLYYDLADTPAGNFSLKVNAAFLDKFWQDASAQGRTVSDAINAGLIRNIPVEGQGSLVRDFGRPEWRWTGSLTWDKGPWQAGWFTSYVGDVYDDFNTLAGEAFIIDSFQTHNLYVQYSLEDETRLRLGVRNIGNAQPPLADTNFGYLGDLHNPAGRFVYASIRKAF